MTLYWINIWHDTPTEPEELSVKVCHVFNLKSKKFISVEGQWKEYLESTSAEKNGNLFGGRWWVLNDTEASEKNTWNQHYK